MIALTVDARFVRMILKNAEGVIERGSTTSV